VFYLKRHSAFISLIYIFVYFAAPGEVEALLLKSGSHHISVKWKKPSSNTHSVTQYVIDWVKVKNGKKWSSTVSGEKDNFVIQDLEPCVQYEVSVRALNKLRVSSVALTGNILTGTAGKYVIHINVLCFLFGYEYLNK
jgi:hypothetical protein